MDNGTALGTATNLVGKSIAWTRYYAGWADKITAEVTSTLTADGEFGYTLRQPYGVVGIIITWNGPLISLAMKIPPAVAAGNTVVVKPSELTPFSGELFAALVVEAGFPPGVINILPGDAASGAALVEHPQVKKVSFTGGPATASKILAACAPTMKPAVLELGGKSANIVFEDADLEAACGFGTVMSVGAMSGQGCAFPTRMLVQESIYEQVVATVKAIAEQIVVGDPFAEGTFAGPVVNQAAFERIQGVIAKAKETAHGWSRAVSRQGSAVNSRAGSSCSRRCSPTSTRSRIWRRTRCSGRFFRSFRSVMRRTRSRSPTALGTVCRVTCTPRISSVVCGWRKSWSPVRC